MKRFDIAAGLFILILLLAIGVTLASGDRVGVRVISTSPQAHAHTRSLIRITFAEPMDTASVESRFVVDPTLQGKVTWSGAQLTFAPERPLPGSQHYAVTIRAGATSILGRKLISDLHWTFDVLPSRVIYLSPAVQDGSQPANLWLVDPSTPSAAKQLTYSSRGVLPDYAPSPDGTRIAYSEDLADGTADLYILTADSGSVQRITQCVRATCQAPDWSPDGTRIVYERTELADKQSPRTWIVNLADLSTAPLLSSSQLLGKGPRWSPDGNQIALYDPNLHNIFIYNLKAGSNISIPSFEGDTGVFDPTGARLIYPELVQTQQGFMTTLAIAHLDDPSKGIQPLVGSGQSPVNDRQATWTPDGKHIAVARQYMDERGMQGAQIYLVDADSADAQRLVVDPQFNHAALSWDPVGKQLVMQRFPTSGGNAQPSIWVYDAQIKALHEIAKNAYLPQWLP